MRRGLITTLLCPLSRRHKQHGHAVQNTSLPRHTPDRQTEITVCLSTHRLSRNVRLSIGPSTPPPPPPPPPPSLPLPRTQSDCGLARSLRARLVEFSDEAAERVARDELLALELDARRGRGVVGLEPLLDGAALVRVAVYLFRVRRRGDVGISM